LQPSDKSSRHPAATLKLVRDARGNNLLAETGETGTREQAKDGIRPTDAMARLSEYSEILPRIENIPTGVRPSQIGLTVKVPFFRSKMRAEAGLVAHWSSAYWSDEATAEMPRADCAANARRCRSQGVSPEESSWAWRKLLAANSLRPSFA